MSISKGKYIESPFSIIVYNKPGGERLKATTPNGYVGKVWGTNTAGTWIDITPGGSTSLGGEWIINHESYNFNDHLTDFQRQDFANRYASKETAAKILQGGAADTTNPLGDLAEGLGAGISGLGMTLRFLPLILVVILVIFLLYKFKD